MKKLSKKKRNKLAKAQNKLTTLEKGNLKKLAHAIDVIETKPSGELYVKFKSDVILDSQGSVAIFANGFNVQFATQIHFNPHPDKDMFLRMMRDSFPTSNKLIVKASSELLDEKMTSDEIDDIVAGEKQMPTGIQPDSECGQGHATEQKCDHKTEGCAEC